MRSSISPDAANLMHHNSMVTASAPGKIILLGEHAVVYGSPALAVPVTQVKATVTVRNRPVGGIEVKAPAIALAADYASLSPSHPLAAAIQGVLTTLAVTNLPPCTINIHSSIPVAGGLGSGAAVSVALIRAFSAFLGSPLPDQEVDRIAFEVEKLHHGIPSGIDNAVVTYGKPVYFIKGKPIITLHVGKPFLIVIAGTGLTALTKDSVAAVRKLWENDKPRWEKVFKSVGEIAHQGSLAIKNGDIPELGRLMDANHTLLQEMTVSCRELDQLVDISRKSGALGAKLSGGGRGGNMIALVARENSTSLAAALDAAGAKSIIVTTVQN